MPPSKSPRSSNGVTYADSGVDIEAGNRLIEEIRPLASETKRSGSMGSLGGFGGLFDLKAAGFDDPVLVSGTDGVGTKLKLATELARHNSIGVDLVAMCVNDILAQGAEPLFFLDYFATSKLDLDTATSVISGIADGCRQAGCALIGGETAEMPGIYQGGDYDLAGFAVGAAERGALLPKFDDMMPGDVLLALPSSGLHSNGYSLVRKLITDHRIDARGSAPFDDALSLADLLLCPTRIYVNPILPLVREGLINGLVHITGGGLTENTPRALPPHLDASIDLTAWTLPSVFDWLSKLGGIEEPELLKTFNCGIGLVLIVAAKNAPHVQSALEDAGEIVFRIGNVISNDQDASRVIYNGHLTGA